MEQINFSLNLVDTTAIRSNPFRLFVFSSTH